MYAVVDIYLDKIHNQKILQRLKWLKLESGAKKEARDRWNKLNPSKTIRLSQKSIDKLNKAASDRKISFHGLLKQIVMEWIENNAG